ncbi:hypothetical protein ACWGH6_29715, partial [Streptomyces xanthophaeus]
MTPAPTPAHAPAPAPGRHPGPAARPGSGPVRGGAAEYGDLLLRVTWVQPEDLIGHELRQAAEDGRDPEPARRAFLAAVRLLAPLWLCDSPGAADPA